MAKKNDIFSYGSAAIPSGEAKYSVIRWGWNGLNRTDRIDTGSITDSSGVVINPPYVEAALVPHNFYYNSEAISVHGFGDRLFMMCREDGKIKVDIIEKNGYHREVVLGDALGTDEDFRHRSMVQFNVATNLENIVEAEYDMKILVFPDSYSMDFRPAGGISEGAYLGDTYPGIHLATVYGSRVFGVDENLVYASAHNDYADWNLDTADDISDAHAWVSMSQSNAKADGEFTAIATYDNHVVLFKRDFMQLVYSNKNPFRIVDVGAYGCDNAYAVAETDGVLYFASPSAVYAFTGGAPKNISEKLDIKNYSGAVLGAWNGFLYLYCGDNLYRYADGVWSCIGQPAVGYKQFASCDWGIAALDNIGRIVIIDWVRDGSGDIPDSWVPSYGGENKPEWWFETDLMAVGKLDVRRVKKVSVLCDADPGASVAVYLLKEDEVFEPETSQLIGHTSGDGLVMLRALTRMTSAYMHRLRFVGRGRVKIYATEIQIAWGGDVYVEG